MSVLEAVILGIVQGLSEFLPISSSGHLALLHQLFGLTDEGTMTFIIVVHVGTLIPVLIFFRKDLWALIKRPFQKTTALLVIATLPAVAAALLFGDFIEDMLGSTYFLAFGFILTGTVLTLSDRLGRKSTDGKTVESMGFMDALMMGCAQGVAILPGISRSGSTITAGLARGLNRENAARFSFLMSIPAIAGGLTLEIVRFATQPYLIEYTDFLTLGIGFAAAAISGYLAISWLLAIVKKAKLSYFAIYVFALAAFIIFDSRILGGSFFG